MRQGSPKTAQKQQGENLAQAVIQKFASKGLLLRSVQQKNSQCLTAQPITLAADKPRDVGSQYCDAWTLGHPSVPCPLYQMGGGDEGKRSVALIVDWTQTKDRIVSCHSIDIASNKKFVEGTQTLPTLDVERVMAEHLTQVKGKTEHNEVRTCQISKEALVGLIWSPITSGNFFAKKEGGATWEATKAKFQEYLQTLKEGGVPIVAGLPVFRYTVEGGKSACPEKGTSSSR
jgi:hypothetical protein